MAVRIRRSKGHAELLEKLCQGSGNPFSHLYEALVFAAALGYARGDRKPFDDPDEPIRWEQFIEIDGFSALVDMLSISAVPENREILAADAEERRIRIFEEFANAGLDLMAAAVETNPTKTAREVVLDLVLAEEAPDSAELDFDSIVESLD